MSKRGRRRAREGNNPGPRPTEPHRENVPGELEHASGQVEEFEAGIVSGAEGDPVDEPGELSDAELERQAQEALGRPEETAPVAARPGTRGAPSPGEATHRGPGRIFAFFRASWAELQRVQWPDRRQVFQATGVVVGFVIVAGIYLGVADWAASKLVDFIL